MRLGATPFAALLLGGVLTFGTGCANDGAKRDDSAVASLPAGGHCASDADCRLLSDYCEGCACRGLAKTDADPACKGHVVQCLVDPCQRKAPVCKAGACTTAPTTP